MPRRILVTGAAGFVGRHAVAALAHRAGAGDRILATYFRGSPDAGPAEWRRLNVLDVAEVESATAAFLPTHILHLAASASVAGATSSPAEAWRANAIGTLNVAAAAARLAPTATFFFISSSEVYGRAFRGGEALTEEACPEPASVYARSKLAAEMMVADVATAESRLIILRPFNHIGPGQDERFVAASFAAQVARIERGARPVIETGDLTAERDFLDVRDVVEAYAALTLRSDELPSRAVYNICSGRPRPVSDLLDGFGSLARISFEVRTDPARLRPNDLPRAFGDASAIAAVIGWRPRHVFADTLLTVLDDARARDPFKPPIT